MAPAAANPKRFTEQTINIVDEFQTAMPFIKTLKFTPIEIRGYLNALNKAFPSLNIGVDRDKLVWDERYTETQLLGCAKSLDSVNYAKKQAAYKASKNFGESVFLRCAEWFEAASDPNSILRQVSGVVEIVTTDRTILKWIECAGKTILLDATLSGIQLSEFWGIASETITVVGCDDRAKDSVDIVVVRAEGFDTNSGGDNRRVVEAEIFKTLCSTYGEQNVGVISHQDHVHQLREGSLYYGSGNRGNNQYSDLKVLNMAGLPFPHVGAVEDAYKVIAHRTRYSSQEFYNILLSAEIIQTIGRLRGFRADVFDGKKVFIVCNHKLDFLSDAGWNVQYEADYKYCNKLTNTNTHRQWGSLCRLAKAAIANVPTTITAVAKYLDLAKSTVSESLKKLPCTMQQLWDGFSQVVQPGKWAKFPESITEPAKKAVLKGVDYAPVYQDLHTNDAIVATRLLSEGKWPTGLKRPAVRAMQRGLVKFLAADPATLYSQIENEVLPRIMQEGDPKLKSSQAVNPHSLISRLRSFVTPRLFKDICSFYENQHAMLSMKQPGELTQTEKTQINVWREYNNATTD
jgi:hypothetical protein